VITQDDVTYWGSDLVGMAQRAAADVVGPEIQRLRAQNAHLQQLAARSQNAEIQRTLDARVPGWRATYANPDFAAWLAAQDDYSGAVRSQLLRDAVAKGDSARVAAIYHGFQQETGHQAPAHQSRAPQSRPAATGGPRIYSRQDIANLYARRRKGEINDATWARWEPAIIKAANEGRIAGGLDRDGNKLTELR
jgi:hypothetical protein